MHLAGQARLRLRGDARAEAREAKSGLIWLSPAGRANAGLEVADGVAEMLQLKAPAEFAHESHLGEFEVALESLTITERGGFSDPVLEALARSVLAEMEAPGAAGPLYADAVADVISAYLLRYCARPTDPLQPRERSADSPEGKRVDIRLERAIAFVEQHLENELSLETLAREASLSLYHFARAFKAATGVAPHRYVLQRRIELARSLLREREMSIAAVAERCGFASQAHLTHVFRRVTGSTPGAFRALVRAAAESI